MRKFLDFLDGQFTMILQDIQTPHGCMFITLVGISAVSLPFIGYMCMDSNECLPYAGVVIMIIGISEVMLLVSIFLIYITKVCLRCCYPKARQYISQRPITI